MNEVLKTAVSLSVSGTLLMAVLYLVFLLPFSPETSIVGTVFEQTDTYVEQAKIQTQEDKPRCLSFQSLCKQRCSQLKQRQQIFFNGKI